MRILKSNIIKEKIEKCANEYLGFINSTLTASGSEAIKFALINAGIAEKTYVVVPVTICRSVVDVILEYGCYPLFCDVDDEFCLDINSLKIPARVCVSAVIYVHAYGLLKDITQLVSFCKNNNLILIEDSAQYFCVDKKYNFLAQGDYVIFSFGEGKPISVGAYGLLASNKNKIVQTPEITKTKLLNKLHKKIRKAPHLLEKKSENVLAYYSLLNEKNNIKLNDNFIDNIYHRFLYIQNENYQEVSDEMYQFMNKSRINNFQSTIIIEAFRENYLKNIKEVADVQNLNLDAFPCYAKLKRSVYYFRTYDKITPKSINKICAYFNQTIKNDDVINDH